MSEHFEVGYESRLLALESQMSEILENTRALVRFAKSVQSGVEGMKRSPFSKMIPGMTNALGGFDVPLPADPENDAAQTTFNVVPFPLHEEPSA